jgi:hypothetical protein
MDPSAVFPEIPQLSLLLHPPCRAPTKKVVLPSALSRLLRARIQLTVSGKPGAFAPFPVAPLKAAWTAGAGRGSPGGPLGSQAGALHT